MTRRKRLAFVLVVNLAFVVLAEIVLLVLGIPGDQSPLRLLAPRDDRELPDVSVFYQAEPRLLWELRPGAQDIFLGLDSINDQTFRGPQVPDEKPKDTQRLAFLGDSSTYGIQLALETTYGERVRSWLERSHPGLGIEIINGGVPGYSLYQGAAAAETKVLALEPDFVVLYFGAWNDPSPAFGRPDSELAVDPKAGGFVPLLYNISRIYRLMRKFTERLWTLDRHENGPKWLRGEYDGKARVPLDEYESILTDFIELCTSKEAQVVLVIPELNRSGRDIHESVLAQLDDYRRVILATAQRLEVPAVDQREIYGNESASDLFIANDAVHPNPTGHLVLARHIFQTIEDCLLRGGNPAASPPEDEEKTKRSTRASIRGEPTILSPKTGNKIRITIDAGQQWGGKWATLIPASRAARATQQQKRPFPLRVGKEASFFLARKRRERFLVKLDEGGQAEISISFTPTELTRFSHGLVGLVARTVETREFDLRPKTLCSPGGFVSQDIWFIIDDE